jgi:putative ABC transport system substrate-binding protein
VTRWVVAAALGLGLLEAPLALAQPSPGKIARIGYLSIRSGPTALDEAFRQGLRDQGWIEGRTISIEYRWADFKADRLASLAEELVRLKVDVLVAVGGNAPALAAKRATETIPVVFTAGDPVAAGIVSGLGRPGGNVTGVSVLTTSLNVKRLELLTQAVPGAVKVAILANPTNPLFGSTLKELRSAAPVLHVQLQLLEARERRAIDEAFSRMAKDRPGALLVLADPMLFDEKEHIVELAMMARVPAAYEWREFVEAGGLMSYGASIADLYRRLGVYVDRILRGAKPAELPVEQPTTFELAINLKTARALGITIPQAVLVRADQVIR